MMFMFTSTHVAAMAAKDAEIEGLNESWGGFMVSTDSEIKYLRETNYALDRTAAKLRGQRDAAVVELSTARATLAQIAAMETPSCASIGRRMASAARGGVAPAAAPVAEGAR